MRMEGASALVVCLTVVLEPLMGTGPISKYLPIQRHLVDHRVLMRDAQIRAVLPAPHVAALHAGAFLHRVHQRAQQHFVVIAEPSGGPLAEQLLHHRRRHAEVIAQALAGRGASRPWTCARADRPG